MSVSGVDRLDPARKSNKPVPLSQRACLGRWDKNIRLAVTTPHAPPVGLGGAVMDIRDAGSVAQSSACDAGCCGRRE